jgi:hypothetical protein
MPFRIADYSETTFSPAGRDFAELNLLICGKLENRSTWETMFLPCHYHTAVRVLGVFDKIWILNAVI